LQGWNDYASKDLDEAKLLIRWQPDCRAAVLQFEALSGMALKLDGTGRNVAALEVHGVTPGGSPPLRLATMSRPERDVLEHQADLEAAEPLKRLMPKSDDFASRARLTEITAQVVPPFAFWCAALPIHPDRMPRTVELMQVMLSLCFHAGQRFKHALAVPRPQYFNPKVFPAILTPSHASLPSGHAAEAYAVSNLLYWLLAGPAAGAPRARPYADHASLRTLLTSLAARIADNRFVAGLHTPIDTSAGRMLGTVLAEYLVARCTGEMQPRAGDFPGAKLVRKDAQSLRLGDHDVTGNMPNTVEPDVEQGGEWTDGVCTLRLADVSIEKSAALAWLWDAARREWTMPT
jgi:hypothetical protein